MENTSWVPGESPPLVPFHREVGTSGGGFERTPASSVFSRQRGVGGESPPLVPFHREVGSSGGYPPQAAAGARAPLYWNLYTELAAALKAL